MADLQEEEGQVVAGNQRELEQYFNSGAIKIFNILFSVIKNWLLILHLTPIKGSVFPGGSLLVPFVCWLYKRHDDEAFDTRRRAVLNFQVSILILFAIAPFMVFASTPVGILLIFTSILCNMSSYYTTAGKFP